MLALHLIVAVLVERVLLTLVLGLLLERLVVVLREDFLIHRTAIIEQLLAEVAELEVVLASLLPLRLQVDLHNCGAQLAVELGVSVFDLGLAEDSLNDNLEDLFADLEAFSHRSIKAILIKQLAVANEHLSQFAHLAFKVVRCDLIELQAHLLSVILLRVLQCRVSLSHGLHLIPDLSHIFLFLGCGWALPIVVIVVVVVVLWTMHSGLESIVLVVAPATPTLSTLIVIIITTTTTSASTLLIVVSPLLAALFLATCELLRFTIISTCDQALMHAHLHNVLRQFHNAFHDVTEIAEQLHCALAVLLHFRQGFMQLVDLYSILIADLLALDVRVGAFDDPLEQKHRFFLGRLNWLRGLSWCGRGRWCLWLECWRLRIHALLHCAT